MPDGIRRLLVAGGAIACLVAIFLICVVLPPPEGPPPGAAPHTSAPAGTIRTRTPAARPVVTFAPKDWEGPGLKYTIDRSANTLKIESGMLMHKTFRWAGSRFSFQFLDSKDLVWGIRLLDSVFKTSRREALRSDWIKLGDKKFRLGEKLPEGQLWKFDVVLHATFSPDDRPKSYRVLDASWHRRALRKGVRALRLSGRFDVSIKRDAWNHMSVSIADGKLTYSVNGTHGERRLELDPETNGRLGIFVDAGGPLEVRNLRLE